MADAVQPLTDAAKQYLAKQFKDITKFQDDVMTCHWQVWRQSYPVMS
jgi:hypothetical protein